MFRNESQQRKRQPAHANTKKLYNMFRNRVNREKDNLFMLMQKNFIICSESTEKKTTCSC